MEEKQKQTNKPRLFRRLYNLIDTHLNPTAQSAMKVNLAAQVIAIQFGAGLNTLVATGKDHCTVWYELYSVMKEVDNEDNVG
jgi:hypothetical protein